MFKIKTIMFTFIMLISLSIVSCIPITAQTDQEVTSSKDQPGKTSDIVAENFPIPEIQQKQTEKPFYYENAVVMNKSIESSPNEVMGWLGAVVSFPEGSQFDDKLVLYPNGTGEIGLTGATDVLENEIISLQDKEMPGKYNHFWGKLSCDNVMDVNGCQLLVTKIRSGATLSEPESVSGWIGQFTQSTFNGGKSIVFILSGNFPMQFSIRADGETIQENIQDALSHNAIVRIDGELITGIPDINGSRIKISNLEIVKFAEKSLPVFEQNTDPRSTWKSYENNLAHYKLRYPENAKITSFMADHFPPEELPENQNADILMENLHKQYGDQLCIRIESGLGYVSISSPQNEINRYVECRYSDKQGNSFIEKHENIEINGTNFNANGYEVTGLSEDLSSHYETFNLLLPNGTYVEYGSIVKADATFEDYQMKGFNIIREIVKTIVFQ